VPHGRDVGAEDRAPKVVERGRECARSRRSDHGLKRSGHSLAIGLAERDKP
jgi:hypothetical protein